MSEPTLVPLTPGPEEIAAARRELETERALATISAVEKWLDIAADTEDGATRVAAVTRARAYIAAFNEISGESR